MASGNFNFNLTGNDNITAKLEIVKKKFQEIQNNGKPLNRQLREMKLLLAQMNLNGLSGTDVFTEITQHAGECEDAIADARNAVSRFASDTHKIDATIQAFQGLAGVISIGTSTMALLGSENEKLAQVMLKVQASIALCNGVQSVANALNKDSALMQYLKGIRLAATTAIQQANTASINKGTIAEGRNTLATMASTAAKNAWNVAVAVGKALVGDFSGLVIVAAAGLATYALASSNSSKEQNKLNKSTKEGKSYLEEYHKSFGQAVQQLVNKYLELQNRWKSLKTTQQQNQFIKDNKKAFQECGLAITDVKSAEDVLVNNTQTFITAISKRAKEMAKFELLKQAWIDKINLMDEMGGEQEAKKFIYTNQKLNDTQIKQMKLLQSKLGVKTFRKDDDGSYYATAEGALKYNKARGYDIGKGNELNKANKTINRLQNDIDIEAINSNKSSNGNRGNTAATTKQLTKLEKLKEKYNELKKAKEDAFKDYNDGIIDESTLRETLNKINGELAKNNFNGINVDLEINKNALANLKKQFDEAVKLKDNGLISDEEFEGISKNVQEGLNKIGAKSFIVSPKVVLKPQWQLDVEVYDEANKQIESIKDAFSKGVISENQAQQLINDINTQLMDVDLPTIEVNLKVNEDSIKSVSEAFDETYSKINNVVCAIDSIDNVSNSITGLSNTLQEGANAWKILMGVVNVFINTMQMVSSILSVVNMLEQMGIITKQQSASASLEVAAAKGIEASASLGAASAAGVETAANTTAAASGIFKAHSWIPFVGVALAVGMVGMMIASLLSTKSTAKSAGSYADGGIIQGNAFSGDAIPIMANANEMILNKKQQRNLFNLLDSNGVIGNRNNSVVTFRLKGSDIYGSLKNYNDKINRTK